MKDQERLERPASLRPRRTVVDGLLVGGKEMWSVVARADGNDADLFANDDVERVGAPFRFCRAVLADGSLVIGRAHPNQDLWLSELMLWECSDEV